MRLIAVSTLSAYWTKHPETRIALERWVDIVKTAEWRTPADIQPAFTKARVLNGDRVRFEVASGDYRLIAAFKFSRQIAFVKFIGTHAEYDRANALTVSQF